MLFSPVRISDKDKYEKILFKYSEKGCEFSFANLHLWGERHISFDYGNVSLCSRFGDKWYYSFILDNNNPKELIDAIILDAENKNIDLIFTGLYEKEKNILEELYQGKFTFSSSPGSYDYVYSIDDLADLSGKKYHKKRNHFSQFQKICPHYSVQEISNDMIPAIAKMANDWYEKRITDVPDLDFDMEKAALTKALANYNELGMDGIVLVCNDEIIAFTMASKLSEDTLDIHFEKARAEINGAYAAINHEFARYIRVKYPAIKYLNREEDMGIEGLRKAKQSYYPHHMMVKYRAGKI